MDLGTRDILGLTAEAYAAGAVRLGVPGGRVGALDRYSRLFRDGAVDQAWRSRAVECVPVPPVRRTLTSLCDEGTTLKFTQAIPRDPGVGAGDEPGASPLARALRLAPSAPAELETESVLIPMIGSKRQLTYTLCVSSQVGCAMGCAFCQTAQMGLIRSLTPAEIVGQWFAATHLLGHRVSNIVFMGMGEPLDNLDNVLAAIAVLTDHRGPAVAMQRVTISTVGRLDGVRRLAAKIREPGWHRLGLAVSLNAPDDATRSAIMPVNRAMPLASLRETLLEWPIFGGFKFCFEYVLIPGVNDRAEHADMAAAFVLGDEHPSGLYRGARLPGMINLIPYNPRENSPWAAPAEEIVEAFAARIHGAGVFVKRRRTKGRETMAACGQLGNPAVRRSASAPRS